MGRLHQKTHIFDTHNLEGVRLNVGKQGVCGAGRGLSIVGRHIYWGIHVTLGSWGGIQTIPAGRPRKHVLGVTCLYKLRSGREPACVMSSASGRRRSDHPEFKTLSCQSKNGQLPIHWRWVITAIPRPYRNVHTSMRKLTEVRAVRRQEAVTLTCSEGLLRRDPNVSCP